MTKTVLEKKSIGSQLYVAGPTTTQQLDSGQHCSSAVVERSDWDCARAQACSASQLEDAFAVEQSRTSALLATMNWLTAGGGTATILHLHYMSAVMHRA